MRAGVIIPAPALQAAMFDLIRDGEYRALHRPAYNVLANPFDLRFQNCTEYVLDIVQSAIYATRDAARIKRTLERYYRATRIGVSSGRLQLASLVDAGVSVADQNGLPKTATFGSLAAYLDAQGLSQKTHVLEFEHDRLIERAYDTSSVPLAPPIAVERVSTRPVAAPANDFE